MQTDSPFDAKATARTILRASRVGSLGTLRSTDGAPYASMVAVAANQHGAPITLISTLAVHTQNILADSRASLLLDQRIDANPLAAPSDDPSDGPSRDPMTRGRISLTGSLVKTGDSEDRARFLRYHPDASFYADFKDFAFYRLEFEQCHLVAGFGRIVDLKASDLGDSLSDAADLMGGEADIVEHLNEDHADAIDLYAQHFAGAAGTGFRCAACDPDGLILARGAQTLFVPFPRRITSPNVLRMALKTMAEEARSGV